MIEIAAAASDASWRRSQSLEYLSMSQTHRDLELHVAVLVVVMQVLFVGERYWHRVPIHCGGPLHDQPQASGEGVALQGLGQVVPSAL